MPNIQGLNKGDKLFACIQAHNARYEYTPEVRELEILRVYKYYYLVKVGDTERKVHIHKVYTKEEYLEKQKCLLFLRTAEGIFNCSGKSINDTVDHVLKEAPARLARLQDVLKTAEELRSKRDGGVH